MDITQVPAGYKLTELGLLPQQWDVRRLGDFVQITSGMSPSLFQFRSEGKPYFKVEQLNCNDQTVIDTPYHTHTKYGVPAGSIVFPKRGASIMLNKIKILKKESFMDTNLMTLTTSPELNNIYLYYWLGFYKLSQLADTTSIPQINNKHIKPISFPFPPLAEQQAIAAALGEMDALLTAQRVRLAKQRAMKQGLLQGLLSGKQRLPGFAGEWEVKRLGEVLEVRHGRSQKDVVVEDGIYPILASGGEIGRTNTYLYNKPSVLIGRKGTIDVPRYMETPFWTVDTLFYTEVFPQALAKYLFYLFNTINWYDFNEASGVPSLNAATIEKISVKMPAIQEQRAIATVLSEADAYLAALEAEHAKTQLLKQGMMQNLLTGKLRLV